MELKSSISFLNWSNLKRNEGQVQLPKFSTSGLLPETELKPSPSNNLHIAVVLQAPASILLYPPGPAPPRWTEGTVRS